jgi:hypothetical protein
MTSTLETLNKTETYYPRSSTKGVDYLEISKSDRNRQRLVVHEIFEKLQSINRCGYAVEAVENSRNISVAQIVEFNRLCAHLSELKYEDFIDLANEIGWYKKSSTIILILKKFSKSKLETNILSTAMETTLGPSFTSTYIENVSVEKPSMLSNVSANVNEVVELQRRKLSNLARKPEYLEKRKIEKENKNQGGIFNKLNKFWKKLWS